MSKIKNPKTLWKKKIYKINNKLDFELKEAIVYLLYQNDLKTYLYNMIIGNNDSVYFM
jgi:hypothetical protein